MKNIDLPNYGFIQARLPKKLHEDLKKECLNKYNRKEMVSGLTEKGVAPHYYLNNKDIFKGIQNTIRKMLDMYEKKYSGYLGNMSYLDKNLPIVFGDPWINYQKPNEYIPLHKHSGVFSYNIYVKLPEDSKFEFHYSSVIGTALCHRSGLTKLDEGVINLFPSTLQHVVYPFMGNETRITLSGNLILKT